MNTYEDEAWWETQREAVEGRIEDALKQGAQREERRRQKEWLDYKADLVSFRTPADEVMLKEEAENFISAGERNVAAATEFFWRFFDFVFAEGPHPGWVLRRLYALARIYRPDLIAHMNGTDLADMFGETRAAQSFRLRCIFDHLGISQISSVSKKRSASAVYAASARGNKSRKNGKKKKQEKNYEQKI